MMFPYVPPLAFDELLYSWLGRIAVLNQLGDPRAALEALFGSAGLSASIDLPVRLRALCERLEYAPEVAAPLIEVGTLYPYYRPFCAGRDGQILEVLLNGGAGGLRMLMGNTAQGFGNAPELRYCPQCVIDDRRRVGFAYWHRSHHLPGVVVCHLHGEILVYPSDVAPRWTKRFILPPTTVHRIAGPVPPWQDKLAEVSSEVLLASVPNLDGDRLVATHLSALRAVGFVKQKAGKESPAIDCIVVGIREHYNDFAGFRHRNRLLSSERTPLHWVRSALQRPTRALHPLCHLLLLQYLYGSVHAFLLRYAAGTPSTASRPTAPAQKAAAPDRQERAVRRKEWRQALSDANGAKAARELAPAVYAWLYRHDREWLLRENGRNAPEPAARSRIDWKARDEEMSRRAQILAKLLAAEAPRKRLTVSRLRRSLGEARVRNEQLPKLEKALLQLAETKDNYHIRRVTSAAQVLIETGRPLTWSNIQRGAGLRNWSDPLREAARAVAREAGHKIQLGRGTLN
jgi:hypothetical protein